MICNVYSHVLAVIKPNICCITNAGPNIYQTPPKCMIYALQQPFKDEIDLLQKQQIIVSQDVDETLEWCKGFVLVPKSDEKVILYLDPTNLNHALIRPVHRDHTTSDILGPYTHMHSPSNTDKCKLMISKSEIRQNIIISDNLFMLTWWV